jgi:hypothetical protein
MLSGFGYSVGFLPNFYNELLAVNLANELISTYRIYDVFLRRYGPLPHLFGQLTEMVVYP